MKQSRGVSCKIGLGYWYIFKARHADKIFSKQGKKQELDRDSWRTHGNFLHMYDLVYEEIEEYGAAVCLETPEWQDSHGNAYDVKYATCCKVTSNLTHPEMCIVTDEVGGYTSQKGNGHVGVSCSYAQRVWSHNKKQA